MGDAMDMMVEYLHRRFSNAPPIHGLILWPLAVIGLFVLFGGYGDWFGTLPRFIDAFIFVVGAAITFCAVMYIWWGPSPEPEAENQNDSRQPVAASSWRGKSGRR